MSEGRYSVEFTNTARKQLAMLDRTVQARILKAASLLAIQPRPPAARRLAASSELWRVRIGHYRLVYRIDDRNVLVVVARVGHRSVVYRQLEEIKDRDTAPLMSRSAQ